MKFKAEFDLDNAIFEDNPEELSATLKRIAKQTINWREAYAIGEKLRHPKVTISDSNGNRIGSWEIVG